MADNNADLREGLEKYFGGFSSTRDLVNRLIEAKSHAQEILILLCARMDALASAASGDNCPNSDAFVRFVTTYGGKHKLLESVSAGDLFYELDYHVWLIPGMLEKAGRFRLFSDINEPIVKFLVGSEIPLTQEEAEKLLRRIQGALRKNFRVAPRQSRAKPPLASVEAITRAILDEFSRRRERVDVKALEKALAPLIRSRGLARILYTKFRCEAIHGGNVHIDAKRFFIEKEPFWKPLYSGYYGPFQLVQFPALFLAALLRDCLHNYRKRLEHTKKVPPAVHFEMFPDDCFGNFELLDESLLAREHFAVPK